ncbi:hypothetical protein BDP27DRAFT_1321475 [Rhodocollybia butyracea]|uniref:Ig-like domain-containing protein n=1 Tax=Rhodocollybia butyracea TaxID=206335 RepID=A0A9P5PYQ2_9AGAR|nr:hypothetical protein BDP27DRAFT_1321475 [Rhodocollybia butyracea]
MFRSLALFALLNAAWVSSIALVPRSNAAVAHVAIPGETDIVNSPDAITVLVTCTGNNLSGSCVTWTSQTLPVTCTSVVSAGQGDLINSAQSSSGIECTLFSGEDCDDTSVLINGTVDNLSTVNFANEASTFSCVSN